MKTLKETFLMFVTIVVTIFVALVIFFTKVVPDLNESLNNVTEHGKPGIDTYQ